MTEIVISIGTKILEYLVEPVLISPLRPVFCFKSIVDDFRDTNTRLTAIRERVGNELQHARDNALVIYDNVEKWVADVDALMPRVRLMENELEENRSCLCSNWTCHYRLSKQVLEKTITMKKLCEDSVLIVTVAHSAPLHQDIIGSSSSVGFKHSDSSKSVFDQIMEALRSDDVKVIGLYGEAGMGKTMLARQVSEEAGDLFDRVIMVSVAQNVQVRSIQGVLADFLNLKLKQESDQGRASQLQLRLKSTENILIILDDVWKEFDLSAVGISLGSCKILLTARSNSNVPDSIQTQRDFQLAILSDDEAWDLFKSIADIGDEHRTHDVAKIAITGCKGLPKAVVRLGRAIRGKSLSKWEEALQQLKEPKLKLIEDLKDQAKKLSMSRDRVKTEIEVAKNNAQEIYEDIRSWLKDVEKVLEDMDSFLNELNQNRSCFDECDGLTRIKADDFAVIATKLCADGRFNHVAYPTYIHQNITLSSSGDFMPSKSAETAFSNIMGALLNYDINMIGLYGMGGIGKTTLTKQVQKQAANLKIFNCIIMVTISQNPKVRNIQGTMADFLGLKLEQETEDGRAEKLSQRLKDEKILIILDDVWKKFDMTTIGVALNECKGCKILLTTRRKDVCTSMDCKTIQLNLWSEGEAYDFFQKKAGLSNELNLNGMAKEIVDECKCLPIALATVGAALKNKGEDEWKEALDSLRNARLVDIPGVDNDEKNAHKCLRLSYDYLADSLRAQQGQFVLLLCSLFPEDHEIDIEDLTRCVYGMELFERVESIADARRKLRVTIRFLKDSCLLLDTQKERYVKMHDVVRDVVLWIGGKEPPERNVYTVRDESDMKELMKKKSFRDCRAVSFMLSSIGEVFKHEIVCPNLETIFFFGETTHKATIDLPDGFFKHMKSLKVLEVRIYGKFRTCRIAMPQSLCNLTDLRTLILKDCECLNSIVLGELGNLEILSLWGGSVDSGIEVVSGLKKLRLLDLSWMDVKRLFPSNVIATLVKLEELHGYIFGDCSGSSLSEFKLLPNLVALTVDIEDASYLSNDFCFPNLQSYDIRVGEKRYRVTFKDMTRRQDRSLELAYVESRMINSFKALFPTVQELHLIRCDDLYSLHAFNSGKGFLEKLEILELSVCSNMVLGFEFEVREHVGTKQLQLLRILKVEYLWALVYLWKGPTRFVSLCNLTEMTITDCWNLKRIFSSPSLATSMQQLEILKISHCGELEEIISRTGTNEADNDFSCCCCFKNLRELKVERCEKLKTIFPIMKSAGIAPFHPQSRCCLPKLQQISLVGGNDGLEHIFGHQSQSEVGVECPSLQELTVTYCSKMSTHFVATQLQASSPEPLRDITMDNIQGVTQLQRGDDDLPLNTIVCFSSLKKVVLIGCNKSKQVFTTPLVASLVHLEELTVQSCGELEQVIRMDEDGQEEGDGNAKTELSMVSVGLKNLRILKVTYCRKLKTIFPVYLPLPKLESLELETNTELEHLFGRGESEWDFNSECPNLNTLIIEDCPKLLTDIVEG